MNRREFLLSLLSVPFGWKALFGKREIESDSLSEKEWNDRMNCRTDRWGKCIEVAVEDSLQEEEGSFQYVQGIPFQPEIPGTFAGLDKVINTGWEDEEEVGSCMYTGGSVIGKTDGSLLGAMKDVLDQCECEVDVKVEYDHCDVEAIFNYRPGQWTYYTEACRLLSEVIGRDAPDMLLQGSYDIDWMPPSVYIRSDCGSTFWCKDIDAEKTQWYRKAEELSHYGEIWELIT